MPGHQHQLGETNLTICLRQDGLIFMLSTAAEPTIVVAMVQQSILMLLSSMIEQRAFRIMPSRPRELVCNYQQNA